MTPIVWQTGHGPVTSETAQRNRAAMTRIVHGAGQMTRDARGRRRKSNGRFV